VVPNRPPQTGLGGTSQQKPVAQQKPAAAPQQPVAQQSAAPATVAVVLPNTGAGRTAAGTTLSGLLALAAALGMGAIGALTVARRRG
jgi:uncharacterized protein HemX